MNKRELQKLIKLAEHEIDEWNKFLKTLKLLKEEMNAKKKVKP